MVDLNEKMAMLDNIISEISIKGHHECLLQKLIKCYLDIYLSKDYKRIGEYIDAFLNNNKNLLFNDFFGQIIKTGESTSAEDDGLGSKFTNGFRSSLIHSIIKKNEALKQIYTSLGVLDNKQECAHFWWKNVVNSLEDFNFEELCQIMPDSKLTNNSFEIFFIRENDLKILLSEKGISEENYSIDYGTMYGGGVLMVGHAVDNMWRKELEKQRQKGLYLIYKSTKERTTYQ